MIDTHCHINIIVKEKFDTVMTEQDFVSAAEIVHQAQQVGVNIIVNIGTSLIESINCVELAKRFRAVYAAVGIHPNDLKDNWRIDLKEIAAFLKDKKQNKIVAIGECGIDKHYEGYNLSLQQDGFKAQIELALENDLAIVVHTRDAGDETLRILENYKHDNMRGVIHCFSEDISFAFEAIELGFAVGIGGAVTYPKNDKLRSVVRAVGLEHIILETDAPYLPPQAIRGKKNSPEQIKAIAYYLEQLLEVPFEAVAAKTTENANKIFRFGGE